MTESRPAPPHAGVHLPPPFVYAAAFLVGYFAQRRHPLPLARFPGAAATIEIIGWTLVGLWVGTMGAALFQFFRHRTTVIPNRPAAALVTAGVYRFTRNPMYVSFVMLYAGLGLLLNSWWPFFLLPVVVVIIDRTVIAREEEYLSSAFPADYAAYRARVRRWL